MATTTKPRISNGARNGAKVRLVQVTKASASKLDGYSDTHQPYELRAGR